MSHDRLRREARAALRGDPSRAGARSHFRAMGIDPERLDGPIVGVASTWTGTMPCNLTRADGTAFLELAPRVPVRTHVTEYALPDAERALGDLRAGRFAGAAVVVP